MLTRLDVNNTYNMGAYAVPHCSVLPSPPTRDSIPCLACRHAFWFECHVHFHRGPHGAESCVGQRSCAIRAATGVCCCIEFPKAVVRVRSVLPQYSRAIVNDRFSGSFGSLPVVERCIGAMPVAISAIRWRARSTYTTVHGHEGAVHVFSVFTFGPGKPDEIAHCHRKLRLGL